MTFSAALTTIESHIFYRHRQWAAIASAVHGVENWSSYCGKVGGAFLALFFLGDFLASRGGFAAD
jgi:hypothetical protein